MQVVTSLGLFSSEAQYEEVLLENWANLIYDETLFMIEVEAFYWRTFDALIQQWCFAWKGWILWTINFQVAKIRQCINFGKLNNGSMWGSWRNG